MAKIYKNQSDFLVIQMNVHEATELDFGIEIPGLNNRCLCDTCSRECNPEDIYYVADINELLCKDCVKDYCDKMNHYCDDNSLTYEVNHFNFYAKKLGMKERANITYDYKIEVYEAK